MLWDCSRRPMFCADAIADPLAGMHAALAAWCSFMQGGGRLLSVALHDVIAYGIQFIAANDADENQARAAEWSGRVTPADLAVRPRRPRGRALERILAVTRRSR